MILFLLNLFFIYIRKYVFDFNACELFSFVVNQNNIMTYLIPFLLTPHYTNFNQLDTNSFMNALMKFICNKKTSKIKKFENILCQIFYGDNFSKSSVKISMFCKKSSRNFAVISMLYKKVGTRNRKEEEPFLSSESFFVTQTDRQALIKTTSSGSDNTPYKEV